MMKSVTLATASLAIATSLAIEPAPPPLPPETGLKPPNIVCVGLKAVKGAWVATFRVVNPNKTAMIAFQGYTDRPDNPPLRDGVISPLYSTESLRDGQWVSKFIGWCGTGTAEVKLVAGSTTTFTAHLGFEGGAEAARVGFNWWVPGGGKRVYAMAWSDPVPRVAIEETAIDRGRAPYFKE